MAEIVLEPPTPITPTARGVRIETTPDHSPAETSVAGVIEMLLKRPGRLNLLLRDARAQRELLPSLMAVAVIGFAAYGAIMTAVVNGLFEQAGIWLRYMPATRWNDASVGNLTLSYTLGLIAANGICLPSFYFYGLLAGVKISMLGVSAHALKGMALGAVALVGLLPLYVAVALTSLVFRVPEEWAELTILFGLVLPFTAGFAGAANLYEGFVGLSDTMTAARREARECFLRRLILAWVGCFTFVTPVVIFTLWRFLGGLTQ